MGDFTVDADELIAVARLLATVRDELGELHGRVDGVRGHGLGSSAVAGALDDFADHWRFGLGRIRDRAAFVAAALDAAGCAYREFDAALAAGIHRAAAPPGGPR